MVKLSRGTNEVIFNTGLFCFVLNQPVLPSNYRFKKLKPIFLRVGATLT